VNTSNGEAVYDVMIDGVGYKPSPSGKQYDIVRSRYISHIRYTATVDSSGIHTFKKHISSAPNGTTAFCVSIQGDICTILRDYGQIKATYSIERGRQGDQLGCSHDLVLAKVPGYTPRKLDADAQMAFDASMFVLGLEKMEDGEWVKV
jgi:hypothetical protein